MAKRTDHSYDPGRYGLVVTDGVFGRNTSDSQGLEENLEYANPTGSIQLANDEDDD